MPKRQHSIIYGLVDPITNHLRYIGLSAWGLSRAIAHSTESSIKLNENPYKNNWIKMLLKQGLRPKTIILQECLDREILNQAEQFWIKYFREMGCPLTNLTDGGEGTWGYKYSITEEKRKKISLANKGRKWSKESIEARAKGLRGKPRIWTEKSYAKVAASRGSESIKDQYENIYYSISDASRKLNLHTSLIYKVLNGKRKHTMGYMFSYVNLDKDKVYAEIRKIEQGRVDPRIGKPLNSIHTMNIRMGRSQIRPFTDNNGNIYQRICEASIKLNLKMCSIHDVLSGKRNSVYGYIFKYLDK